MKKFIVIVILLLMIINGRAFGQTPAEIQKAKLELRKIKADSIAQAREKIKKEKELVRTSKKAEGQIISVDTLDLTLYGNRTFEEWIKVGNYSKVDAKINAKNFPIPIINQTTKVKAVLIDWKGR